PPLTISDIVQMNEIAGLFEQPGCILSVSFSPDGRTVASGNDHLVTLWDVAQGQISTRLKHSTWVRSVMFSHDGTRLATCGEDTTVRLWNSSNGQTIATFKGHKGTVNSVVFSPDGKTLVSGGQDHTLKLWDLSSLHDRDVLRGHKEGAYSIAFSPDDRILASASHDHTVKLWDVKSGQELATRTNHT